LESFCSKINFLVWLLFFLASGEVLYFAYGWMMQVGVDQGYASNQPNITRIKFPLDNKIVSYCHSSARVIQHSGNTFC